MDEEAEVIGDSRRSSSSSESGGRSGRVRTETDELEDEEDEFDSYSRRHVVQGKAFPQSLQAPSGFMQNRNFPQHGNAGSSGVSSGAGMFGEKFQTNPQSIGGFHNRRPAVPTPQLGCSLPIAVPHFLGGNLPPGPNVRALPSNGITSSFQPHQTFGQRPFEISEKPRNAANSVVKPPDSFQGFFPTPPPAAVSSLPYAPDSPIDEFVPPHLLSSSVTQGNGFFSGSLQKATQARRRYSLGVCPQGFHDEENIVGNPGKGRDAIKVRDMVLQQTGFTAN